MNGSGVESSGVWPTAEIAPASARTPTRRSDASFAAGEPAAFAAGWITGLPSTARLTTATSVPRAPRRLLLVQIRMFPTERAVVEATPSP